MYVLLVNAQLPNALLLLVIVNAFMPGKALMILDEQRKDVADRNLIPMPCSQNTFPVLHAQHVMHSLAS